MLRIARYAVPISVILAALLYLFLGPGQSDLRGWWVQSDDGKTYLVVEDDKGVPTKGDGNGDLKVCLDDAPWPYKTGERGEISPGPHELGGCYGSGIGFTVLPGVEYHFDYWGP